MVRIVEEAMKLTEWRRELRSCGEEDARMSPVRTMATLPVVVRRMPDYSGYKEHSPIISILGTAI